MRGESIGGVLFADHRICRLFRKTVCAKWCGAGFYSVIRPQVVPVLPSAIEISKLI